MYINKNEVLRYLGYKSGAIEDNLNGLIDECIEEIKKYSNNKYTYKIFSIEKENDIVRVLDSNLVFKGESINRHLKNSSMCAILGVTLGGLVDTKVRYYEKINLTKALILDACATTAVEWACDEAEKEIRTEAHKRNLGITYRFSPGYGDLSIEIQSKILMAIDAEKRIGLTVTESNILLPRKSVTAIIGFQDKSIISEHPGCKECNNYNKCGYRKGGNYCGS